MAAQNLKSNGQARTGGAAGDTDPRDTGQIASDRVDVGQVHGQRVIGLFADLESRGGRGGGDDGVHFLKSRFKVTGQERADFLRLEVVGAVVAGAEGVGAKHDAA